MVIIAEATEHDEQVAFAEELMDKEDYRGAVHEASKVLDELEPTLPTIAQAALTKGRALMTQTLTDMSETGKLPPQETFETIWKVYELSNKLNPECETTKEEMKKVTYLLREIPPPRPPKAVAKADFDVIVVGAGPAGIGTAVMLTKTFGLHSSRVQLIERGENAGTSFRQWPKQMKFISPSFNMQGWSQNFDLNSIAKGTSPAYSLHTEHPSGNEYADYLEGIAKLNKLNVRTRTEVFDVQEANVSGKHSLFNVGIRYRYGKGETEETKSESITARYIVWAAGEFQYPKMSGSLTSSDRAGYRYANKAKKLKHNHELPGSEFCMHNSTVRSWAEVPGDEFIVIGGYESGLDAAINLSKAGKKCRVVASTPCWSVKTTDPSSELAPYTAARLRDVLEENFEPKPKLYAPLRVVEIEKMAGSGGGYNVVCKWKGQSESELQAPRRSLRDLVKKDPTEPRGTTGDRFVLHTKQPPILCTGFDGSVAARASHLFEFADSDDNEVGSDDTTDEESESGDELEHNGHTHTNQKKGGCLAGAPLLTENDESTIVPGVFLVGPTVSHGKLSFCFVYKFRQRFAVVANAICKGLGMDTRAAVKECRQSNMFLDDFSCCGDTCGDVC